MKKIFEFIPENWSEIELINCFEESTGGANILSSEYSDAGVPIILKSDVRPMCQTIEPTKFVPEKIVKAKYGSRTVMAKDLLLCMRDLSQKAQILGLITACEDRQTGYVVAQGVTILRGCKIDGKFVSYFSNTESFRNYIFKVKRGSTQVHLGNNDVFEVAFPLPPMLEQRRIVAKIDSSRKKIKLIDAGLSKVESLIEKYRESLLRKAFSGRLVPRSQNEWSFLKVGDVGEVKLGRQRSPKNHQGKHMRPYLRVANVFEEKIDISDVMSMNFEPAEFERFQLRYGDILLNEGQSIDLVGRPAMFRDEIPSVCFTNTLVRFRAGPMIDQDYALQIFLWYFKTGRFSKIAKAGTNIAHLGADRFASLLLPIPPLEEQKRIVAAIQAKLTDLQRIIGLVTSMRRSLERIDKSVLENAFLGRLVQKNAEEGTGQDLLEALTVVCAPKDQVKKKPFQKKTPPRTGNKK